MDTKRHRVFVDTNVWASILWKPGSATARAVALLREGRVSILVSETVLEELARFVRRDAVRRPAIVSRHRGWLEAEAPWSEVLPDPSPAAVARLIARVPTEDAVVAAAALAGGAEFLLTGDSRFLAALPAIELRPLSPAEVLRLHASGESPWASQP